MSKTDYEGASFSMTGIPDGCWRDVPFESQARVVAAFPDLRLLWNPVIAKYQCVQKDDSVVQPMWGLDGSCVLDGWVIINGNYPRAATAQQIVEMLRVRTYMAEEAYMKDGGIDALADRLAEEELKRREKELHEKFVDALGIDSWTGHVNTFHRGQIRAGYGDKATASKFQKLSDLPVAPGGVDRRAVPASRPLGLGKKELARRARQIDRSLREGAPL